MKKRVIGEPQRDDNSDAQIIIQITKLSSLVSSTFARFERIEVTA